MSSSRLARHVLGAALLLALAAPAIAAPTTPRVRAIASAGAVQLEPSLRAPAWLLRVSGPDGKVAERTILDGEPLRIEPKLLGYPGWREGSYQYELVPVLGDRQRGSAVAAQAGMTRPATDARGVGSFRVQGGSVIVAGGSEPASRRRVAAARDGSVGPLDQVIPDDLIVQSSACVGIDCVDAEDFGFDTIRMKENSLRIHFDDTSTLEGFAANDWRLVANDAASGGASKFMLEDATANRVPLTVEAGAPADAVYVDSSGNIGFGTATPAMEVSAASSDTPTLRLEQNGTGGYTPQTWDIGANEANFFVRDSTGGSRLSLRIRPGAPTSSVDIAPSGNVGFGTASPGAALHAQRTTGPVALRLTRTSGESINAVIGWEMLNDPFTGFLTFADDPTGGRRPLQLGRNVVDNLLRVGVLDKRTVDINGTLKVTGNIQVTGSVGPDYVFAPGFALPSIAEHADAMWRERHLPKVGPARVEDGVGVMDLGTLGHGMLEELEVAHVYIARLDETVQDLQARLAERDVELERMRAQIDAIQASLAK